MPDLLVGAPIVPADTPAAVFAQDLTTINNITQTTPATPGSPLVAVTWVAPTSGVVAVNTSVGGRDGAGGGRVFAVPETFEGTDATGASVIAANQNDQYGVVIPRDLGNWCVVSRRQLLTGLTAGATYYTRHVHWADTSGTADINVRDVLILPRPASGIVTADEGIFGVDTPPTQSDSDNTPQNNIDVTVPTSMPPTVAVAFVAPTSGAVAVTVGVGGRDNSGGGNRVHCAPEVFVRDANGEQVVAADYEERGIATPTLATGFWFGSRTTLLTGLVAGQVYYARAMTWVSGGNTADITRRDILVEPA